MNEYFTVLGIFAKYWEAGKVKTRLAAGVGDKTAARVYQSFVKHLTHVLSEAGDRRELHFAPIEALHEFRSEIAPAWKLVPQSNGDLGQRMNQFFAAVFAKYPLQNPKVVLIGTDSPWLDQTRIDQAFQALANCDVVIGPSEDGGYYLIGMNQPVPELFEGIEWSSDRVFSASIEILKNQGVKYLTLPIGYDIDERQDLIRFRDSIFEQQQANLISNETRSLLVTIEKELGRSNIVQQAIAKKKS